MTREQLRALRFANFKLLSEEFGERELQAKLMIRNQRRWQLMNQSGSFGGNLARTFEGQLALTMGWFDKEHPEGLLPSDRTLDYEYFAERLEQLDEELRKIEDLELRTRIQKLAFQKLASI